MIQTSKQRLDCLQPFETKRFLQKTNVRSSTTPKADLSSEESNVLYLVWLKMYCILQVTKSDVDIRQVFSVRPIDASIQWSVRNWPLKRVSYSIRTTAGLRFLWRARSNWYRMTRISRYTHRTHQTFHLFRSLQKQHKFLNHEAASKTATYTKNGIYDLINLFDLI